MLSYSRSFTYAPISAIYMNHCQQGIGDTVAWSGIGEVPTCFTFTITKLSTSGYFSSAGQVSLRSNEADALASCPAHRRIDNSSATSWRLFAFNRVLDRVRVWVGRRMLRAQYLGASSSGQVVALTNSGSQTEVFVLATKVWVESSARKICGRHEAGACQQSF